MRPGRWLCAAAALAAFAVPEALTPPAEAGRGGSLADGVYHYPGDVGSLSLGQALATPALHTIVFQRGRQPFSGLIYVFGRTGLTLCGATDDAGDSVIESSASLAIVLDECRDIEIRNLTILSTHAAGEGIRLQSVSGTEVEGFVDGVTVRNTRIEAAVPIRARPRARNLSVSGCRLEVNRANGYGLVWEDGEGLFVTRTRFATSGGTSAVAGLFVRGADDPTSEGDRARRVILTRNTVLGDFAIGFDLSDVVDARVRRNVIRFPDPLHEIDTGGGRLGVVVRRSAASAQTEDWELRSNRVSGAHTGAWIVNAGRGAIVGNILRGCGSEEADAELMDTGSALRMNLQGPVCNAVIQRNDLRNLRSPAAEPACIVLPPGTEAVCFPDGAAQNRWDAGRPLYEGGPMRRLAVGSSRDAKIRPVAGQEPAAR